MAQVEIISNVDRTLLCVRPLLYYGILTVDMSIHSMTAYCSVAPSIAYIHAFFFMSNLSQPERANPLKGQKVIGVTKKGT